MTEGPDEKSAKDLADRFIGEVKLNHANIMLYTWCDPKNLKHTLWL